MQTGDNVTLGTIKSEYQCPTRTDYGRNATGVVPDVAKAIRTGSCNGDACERQKLSRDRVGGTPNAHKPRVCSDTRRYSVGCFEDQGQWA